MAIRHKLPKKPLRTNRAQDAHLLWYYGKKVRTKVLSQFLPGHKKREVLESMKLFSHDSISMSMEDWDYCNKRIAKASNIRKKRDYRMQKRIDYLDYREKYEGLRDKFMGGKDITFHDMDFIYDGFSMLLTHMETHTYGESSRVDYLKKLIKYIEMDSDNEFLNPQKLVVLCKVSSLHPLSLKEEEDIKSEFQMLAGKGKLVFGTREVSSGVVDCILRYLFRNTKNVNHKPTRMATGFI